MSRLRLKKPLPPILAGMGAGKEKKPDTGTKGILPCPRPETPSEIVTRPQAFKDTLYGAAEKGWLTIFCTPSRQTVWFPVTEPMPDLDLSQNCYLGVGLRGQRPDNHRTRGKTDDIIGIPGLWLDLDYDSPGAHKVEAFLATDRGRGAVLARRSALQAFPHHPLRTMGSRSTGCSRSSPGLTPETTERQSGGFAAAGSTSSCTPAATVAGTSTARPILPASCASRALETTRPTRCER